MSLNINIENYRKKTIEIPDGCFSELENRVYKEIKNIEYHKTVRRKRYLWYTSIAALIIILLVVGIYIEFQKSEKSLNKLNLYSCQDKNYTIDDYIQELSEDEIVDMYSNESSQSIKIEESLEADLLDELEIDIDE